jgi:type I restriction enzyme S subunit
MNNISLDDLRQMDVRVAPSAEQSRIVQKLEEVLEKLESSQKRLAKIPVILKRFRQSVLAAAYSGRLTADWRDCESSTNVIPHPEVIDEHGKWSSDCLPDSWRWLLFEKAFIDLTDSKRKLPQKDYELSGPYPVIDQGEQLIGGYTSRRELVSKAMPPTIVFGDHTRCVKWIDTEFAQGADGVKVLLPRDASVFGARFAYFSIKACQLPDKGYSRHMKFLKATMFPCPPIAEQQEIVRRVESLFALADQIEVRFQKAQAQVEKMTPAILAKAFRGELVPQDPTDEPAEKLLERIKHEKE